jgi:hypothetical protein
MKKEYIVGGLAIVGALALFAYLRPKGARRNSDGFFGANGRLSRVASSQSWCARRNADGSVNYMTNNFSDTCPKGWKSVKAFGDRDGI